MVGTAGKPSLLGRLGRRHAHLITAACTPSHVDSKAPARPCMNTCPLRTHQGHIRDDEGQPEAAIAAPVDVVGEAGQPLNQRVQRARLQDRWARAEASGMAEPGVVPLLPAAGTQTNAIPAGTSQGRRRARLLMALPCDQSA